MKIKGVYVKVIVVTTNVPQLQLDLFQYAMDQREQWREQVQHAATEAVEQVLNSKLTGVMVGVDFYAVNEQQFYRVAGVNA